MTLRLAAIFALSLCVSPLFAEEGSYEDGYEPPKPSPFPADYKDYQILPGTLSPDKKFACVYPKHSLVFDISNPRLVLAELKPFRVVTEIPLGEGLLTGSHSSYHVEWAQDASAALVTEGSKWGPEKVFLVPAQGEKPGKPVDLTAQVRKILQPDFNKAKPAHYNDIYDFIFETDDNEKWHFASANTVVIDCTCTTDPKGASDHRWSAHFKGTWDIAKGTLTQKKFVRAKRG